MSSSGLSKPLENLCQAFATKPRPLFTLIGGLYVRKFWLHPAKQTCEYGIRYVLIGDNKQLEPFNAARAIASLNVSPNQILLVNGIEPLKLTEVYRCHPAATKILSNIFYSGRLSSGRSCSDFYLQSRLLEEMFRCGSSRAFDIRFNTFQSTKIVQSRSNEGEAAEIGFYAKRLIEEFEFHPSEIFVILLFKKISFAPSPRFFCNGCTSVCNRAARDFLR
uniref:AAA_12 domain-containing protein n=1 Tax=Caenorhabditis japonica TaxID=281687 RepID=A0A8R1DPT5_CAEJA